MFLTALHNADLQRRRVKLSIDLLDPDFVAEGGVFLQIPAVDRFRALPFVDVYGRNITAVGHYPASHGDQNSQVNNQCRACQGFPSADSAECQMKGKGDQQGNKNGVTVVLPLGFKQRSRNCRCHKQPEKNNGESC